MAAVTGHGDGGHRRRPFRDIAAYEDIAAAQVAVVSLLRARLGGWVASVSVAIVRHDLVEGVS
jgi:hypothetical protein